MTRYATQDGRSFTDKIDSTRLTDALRKQSGTSSSNAFREWLQKNALSIMQQNLRSDPRYNPYNK